MTHVLLFFELTIARVLCNLQQNADKRISSRSGSSWPGNDTWTGSLLLL